MNANGEADEKDGNAKASCSTAFYASVMGVSQ